MVDPYADGLGDCRDAGDVADRLLAKATSFSGAPMGNVQLMDRSHEVLTITAQTGFGGEFLSAFAQVDAHGHSVCAEALKRREAVTVEDVREDTELAPYRAVFAHAGVRAVRSVPLISRSGEMMGMVSVHFREPQKMGLAELVTLARFGRLAADRLVSLSRDDAPQAIAEAVSRRRPSKANLIAWGKMGFKSKS